MHINCAVWAKPVDRFKTRRSTVSAQNAQITCTSVHNVYIFKFLSTGPFWPVDRFQTESNLPYRHFLFLNGCFSFSSPMIMTFVCTFSQRVTTVYFLYKHHEIIISINQFYYSNLYSIDLCLEPSNISIAYWIIEIISYLLIQ